jgi:hypothetical protein
MGEGIECKVRPPAARDHRFYHAQPLCSRNKGGRRSRTCTKVTDVQVSGQVVFLEPVGCAHQSLGKKADVKAQVRRVDVYGFFFNCQKVHQECRKARVLEYPGDVPVPRAVPAAAAAVGKDNQPSAFSWKRQVCLKNGLP